MQMSAPEAINARVRKLEEAERLLFQAARIYVAQTEVRERFIKEANAAFTEALLHFKGE
jgi:hypothetical protein